MGETDDKDPPQQTNGAADTVTDTATTPAEDAKETDKLLKDDKKVEVTKDAVKDDVKVNGEEIINIPEEKEVGKDEESEKEPKKKVNAEEKEVKPKKIPIGGIKIPGFFTRNKDKSKNDGDGAENELLKEGETDDKPKEEGEVPPPKKSFLPTLPSIKITFKNPFVKKPETTPVATDEAQENKENAEKADDADTEPATDDPTNDSNDTPKTDGNDKGGVDEPKADNPPAATSTEGDKKPFLQSIKLPTIGSLIPKRLRRSSPDDIELGNGPNTRAGLASMETLDDSLKDTDKDVTDKANPNNATDEDKMETIKLNDDKDAEKAAEAEQDKVKTTFVDRLRTYRCSIGKLYLRFMQLPRFSFHSIPFHSIQFNPSLGSR